MDTGNLDYTKMTGWTLEQRAHLNALIAHGATIAYYNTDAHGRPANLPPDVSGVGWEVKVGLVQKLPPGPLKLCSERALHATLKPHMWKGNRVWLVGLLGEVREDGGNKFGSLHRENIGEILPEHCFDPSVLCRLGQKELPGADLSGAYLSGANLSEANLSGADLSRANLSEANLYGANLYGANLYGANLSGADLYEAYLYGANLSGADLYEAYLYGANLSGADLSRAYLSGANLSGADLGDWERGPDGYARRKAT